VKVRMNISIGSAEGWSYAPGDVVELDDELARKWIEIGHAEPVIEQAVKSAPENALSSRGKAK